MAQRRGTINETGMLRNNHKEWYELYRERGELQPDIKSIDRIDIWQNSC